MTFLYSTCFSHACAKFYYHIQRESLKIGIMKAARCTSYSPKWCFTTAATITDISALLKDPTSGLYFPAFKYVDHLEPLHSGISWDMITCDGLATGHMWQDATSLWWEREPRLWTFRFFSPSPDPEPCLSYIVWSTYIVFVVFFNVFVKQSYTN